MFDFKTRDQALTINFCQNGYVVDFTGRTHDGDWKTYRIITETLDETLKLIAEYEDIKTD